MWWSPTHTKDACSPSAQLYHFDMDRTKWLLAFVYLTDVTTDNGPHCFVAGSHRPGPTTRELLKLGHTRIPDATIEKHYPKESILELTGPRGTVIIEDSRGFHKGKAPRAGERLLLEVQFCNSLFGATSPRATVRTEPNSPLANMMAQLPEDLSAVHRGAGRGYKPRPLPCAASADVFSSRTREAPLQDVHGESSCSIKCCG